MLSARPCCLLSRPCVPQRRAVCDRLLNLASSRHGTLRSSGSGCSSLPSGLRQAWLRAGPESSGGLPCDSGNLLQIWPARQCWQSPLEVAGLVQDLNLGLCPGRLLSSREERLVSMPQHTWTIKWQPGAYYQAPPPYLNTTGAVCLQPLSHLFTYYFHPPHLHSFFRPL